jgi:hypothetical protein
VKALELQAASIDWQGASISELSLRSNAARIALVGDWSPLVAYLCGDVNLADGSVRIGEQAGRDAVVCGLAGVTPLDVAPPAQSTVGEWIALALQLLGHPRRRSDVLTRETLSQLGLRGLQLRRVGTLAPVELWAAGVAVAAASSPELLMVSDTPRVAEGRDFMLGVLEQLATHRACTTLVLAPDADAAEPVCSWADQRFQLNRSGRLQPEVPDGVDAYLVKARHHVAQFVTQLAARGARVVDGPTTTSAYQELTVSVHPEAGTAPLIDAAISSNTAILQLKSLRRTSGL